MGSMNCVCGVVPPVRKRLTLTSQGHHFKRRFLGDRKVVLLLVHPRLLLCRFLFDLRPSA
jgi:hypothetical protein